MASTDHLQSWLSIRVRMACVACFVLGSLLPPYVPKTALATQGPVVGEQQFLLVEDGFLMKSSSLTRYGARRAYTQGKIHVVKDGENIENLATRYDLNIQTILWANNLQRGGTIYPGDELIILPVDGVLHNVTRGQTLNGIAQLYEVEPQNIIERNDLKSSYILAGQELIIPDGKPIISKVKTVASAELPPPGNTEGDPTPGPVPTPDPPAVDVAPSAGTPSSDLTYSILQKPCSAVCFITQYYRAGHYALDMQERGGGPIYASEAGTVIRSDYGWNGGYGNVIEIDHGNGLVTLYAHNKEHVVSEGQLVDRGQHIANMGSTGKVYGQTGIHTHFEVRVNGVKKNPLLYLQ